MATSVATIEYIEDQLADLPRVRSQKMFGEYALYIDEKVVALVCDDTLFVKITPAGETFVGHDFPTGYPYPGARPAFQVSDDQLEDREWLMEFLEITAEALPLPKAKKKRRS